MTTESSASVRARAFTARQSTEVLIISLQDLGLRIADATPIAKRTNDYADVQAYNLARSWAINELEERFPAAADKVAEAFDAAAEDEFLNYDALLISAIRELRNGGK